MKKRIGDLLKGDLLQVYQNRKPLQYPFEVVSFETWESGDKIKSLVLQSSFGEVKKYSFLNKVDEVEIWDVSVFNDSESVCLHCGSVIN